MSDKQDAFVTGIEAEFPDVPHRYCQNHFLRDLAKPMLEQDSHAKVQMRKKVRGLRDIEKQVLEDRRAAQAESLAASAATAAAVSASVGCTADESSGGEALISSVVGGGESAASTAMAGATGGVAGAAGEAEAVEAPAASATTVTASSAVVEPAGDEAGQVVLDYCAAVRGILNDDQGGPLHPPGIRMAEALQEVRESLQRNLDAKKGGAARSS
jgi:hypothetical protein